MTGDRPLYKDIEAVTALVATGELSGAVARAVGVLS
jgi:hypothetical protein